MSRDGKEYLIFSSRPRYGHGDFFCHFSDVGAPCYISIIYGAHSQIQNRYFMLRPIHPLLLSLLS